MRRAEHYEKAEEILDGLDEMGRTVNALVEQAGGEAPKEVVDALTSAVHIGLATAQVHALLAQVDASVAGEHHSQQRLAPG